MDVQGAEEAGNFQMSALDPSLVGAGLEGSIELIDQGLHHRLEQLAGGLEDEFPKLPLEGQELLLGRVLIEELFDVSGGFLLEGFLDLVAFSFLAGRRTGASHGHRGIDKLVGQFFKLFAAFDGLGQGLGMLGRQTPGLVLAVFPNLMFEVRATFLVWVSLGGARFGLERAAFHAVDLLHLLEELLTFMGEWVHVGRRMTSH